MCSENIPNLAPAILISTTLQAGFSSLRSRIQARRAGKNQREGTVNDTLDGTIAVSVEDYHPSPDMLG